MSIFRRLRLAYQEYDKLQAKIGDKQTALVTSKMQINPLIKLMQQEEEQCRRWGGLLGLDPTGRARIGLARNRKEEQSEFEKFLNNVQDDLNDEI
jgi:phage terminase small subunit